jgi:hypothetical protein
MVPPANSSNLLESLKLDLPSVDLPDELDHPVDPDVRLTRDRDDCRYVGSGPKGAHEHIFVGN